MSIENPSLLYLDQPLTDEQKAVARENIGAQAAEYGKGLSTNDYTLAEKNKLGGIAAGAQVNTIDSISVNGVAQSVEEKNVDITIPVVGIQVGGTDVTPDSNHKVNLEIPSGVQRNGIDLTPDANNKVNVVVPVLGIKLAGSMAVPDSEKVVSIPLAQGPNSGVATTNGLLSSTDKGKIDNMITTVKMNNTELPKSSGAVNIPLFGGSSNPGVVSSTASDASKFLQGDGTWGNPTVVHQLGVLEVPEESEESEDPTGYAPGYYLCDVSSDNPVPITYADFSRLYATGTITVVESGSVYVLNTYMEDSTVIFSCNNYGLSFGCLEDNTDPEHVIRYVYAEDEDELYAILGVNGVVVDGHDLEFDYDGWVDIPIATGSSPATESSPATGPSTGLMSGTDKDKLDAYPSVPDTSTSKFLKDDGTWDTPTGTTYSDYAGSTHGLVPPRPSGSTVTKYLREDGQWEVPAGGGSGTVTSVSMGSGSQIGPTNGNVALTLAAGGSTPADGIMSGNDKVKLDAYAAVPASASQTGKFMKDDGTWDRPLTGTDLTTDSTGAIKVDTNGTIASGVNYGFVEGYNTAVNSNYSHAEGNGSVASGNTSHAEGVYTNATGIASHSEGSLTTANGTGAHAGGYSTSITGRGNFIHGSFLEFSSGTGTENLSSNTPVFVCGTLNSTTAQNYNDHGGYLMIVGNGTYVDQGQGTHSDAMILHRDGLIKARAFQNADGSETINNTSYNFNGIGNVEVFSASGAPDPANFPQDNVIRIILES